MSGRPPLSKVDPVNSVDKSGELHPQKVHRLRFALRRLERNRKLYLQEEEEEEKLCKQRQKTAELHAEQERLLRMQRERERLAVEADRALLKQRDKLVEEIKKEKQIQAEQQKEITIMEKKLLEMKRGQTSHDRKSHPRKTQTAIRATQNKLDWSSTRFNEQMTINSQIREDIELLQMQRTRFQHLYRNLEKVRQDICKEIAEVVDKSAAANDAKVEAQTETSMVKETALKDLAQYSAEMEELKRVIAHEHQLKKFISTKNNQRASMDNEKRTRRRQEMKADAGEETLDCLKKAFQQIQEVTGEDNLGKLVTKFIQGEEWNFALFNFVNDQTAEAERVREEIQQIRKDTDQLNIKSRQEKQECEVALKQLKNQLQERKAQTQQYEAKTDHISGILDQVKTGLDRVFEKTDCNLGLMGGMLGSSSGITDSNLMTYLGMVEQKASELLTIKAFIKSKDPEISSDMEAVALFLLGQKPDFQTQEAIAQPPITRHEFEAEDSSLMDEVDRPLTSEEIRQYIMRKSDQHKVTKTGQDKAPQKQRYAKTGRGKKI